MSLTAYTPTTWVDYAESPDLRADYLNKIELGIDAVTDELIAFETYCTTNYQPKSAELTAVAGLSGVGLAKRTGAGTWTIDTTAYAPAGTGALTATYVPFGNGTALTGTQYFTYTTGTGVGGITVSGPSQVNSTVWARLEGVGSSFRCPRLGLSGPNGEWQVENYYGALQFNYGSANPVAVMVSSGALSLPQMNVCGAAGTNRDLTFISGLVTDTIASRLRWNFRVTSTAESGSNAGSDFELKSWADNGAAIDTVFSIARVSGGAFTIGRPTTCTNFLYAYTFTATGVSGNARGMQINNGALRRWNIGATAEAESTGNAGSNFQIYAYDDSGAGIDMPISIPRVAGGAMLLNRPVKILNALTLSNLASNYGKVPRLIDANGQVGLSAISDDGTTITLSRKTNPTVGVFVTQGASDTVESGSYLELLDAVSKTKGWALQLGASNTLDIWNYASSTWTKRLSADSSGNLTATSFVKSGGTSSQFLKANGSVDSTVYQPTKVLFAEGAYSYGDYGPAYNSSSNRLGSCPSYNGNFGSIEIPASQMYVGRKLHLRVVLSIAALSGSTVYLYVGSDSVSSAVKSGGGTGTVTVDAVMDFVYTDGTTYNIRALVRVDCSDTANGDGQITYSRMHQMGCYSQLVASSMTIGFGIAQVATQDSATLWWEA